MWLRLPVFETLTALMVQRRANSRRGNDRAHQPHAPKGATTFPLLSKIKEPR
jgi:hypothetical protein